MQTQR